MAVRIETCELFTSSVVDATKQDSNIRQLIKDFVDFKSKDPTARYGGKDESLSPQGIYTNEIPKIRKAHLTRDMSIWYTISGKDPHVIRLYGVFDHRESGTGTPDNRKKQRTLASRMSNQKFS